MNIELLFIIGLTSLGIVGLTLIMFAKGVAGVSVSQITSYVAFILMIVSLGVLGYTHLILNPAILKTTLITYSVVTIILGIINVCEHITKQTWKHNVINFSVGASLTVIGFTMIYLIVSNNISALS